MSYRLPRSIEDLYIEVVLDHSLLDNRYILIYLPIRQRLIAGATQPMLLVRELLLGNGVGVDVDLMGRDVLEAERRPSFRLDS